jgi:hypothetical protein
MKELLDAYSRQVATELFDEYPAWERFLEIEAEGEENSFRVVIQSPNKVHAGELEVTTKYNNEITVFFYGYHAHFTSLRPSAEERGDALRLIRSFLTEELVMVEYGYFGIELIPDGWKGSTLVPPSNVPDANYEHHYASKIRVLSWQGTYDQEFDAPYLKSRPVPNEP